MADIVIRPAREDDAQAVCAIYDFHVAHGTASFDSVGPSADEWAVKIGDVTAQGWPFLVAERGGAVVGYAYAAKWHERSAYRNTVEVSVYLHHECGGKGLGTMLYEELFRRLKAKGLHVVIGGIALPNPQSEKLHEKFGMEKVGHFSQVGYKLGQWVDVGYWQVQLNA